MSKPKAIVTRRWPTANEERLKEHFDVTFNESDVPFTSDQLKDALKNSPNTHGFLRNSQKRSDFAKFQNGRKLSLLFHIK